VIDLILLSSSSQQILEWNQFQFQFKNKSQKKDEK